MLEGIEPSIALTGGPWYTDNELDTEFIQNLTEACYKFISDIVSHLLHIPHKFRNVHSDLSQRPKYIQRSPLPDIQSSKVSKCRKYSEFTKEG